MTGGWSAVVVFKGRGASKSRLELADRAALAEAFLLDTLAAVAAARGVSSLLLVTSDVAAASAATGEHPALVVVPDPGTLDAAVSLGAARALLERPEAPVVVLTGDLPALVAADLDRALSAVAGALPAVVPDREGSGTTALLLSAGALIEPAFGPHSLERHRAAGCAVVPVPDTSTLRLDVDTVADLRDAEEVGVGPHTALALAAAA
ncbi:MULTISPECIES: 2-phospho-L-lactate guanylyltransferase [unclassified Rathayibacter]|uniref:2-phospho-L-lactate guanylyltransferase n=1 Tax=unclassified Rathayibacter TaxID=2609250 RepID=UPI00188AB44D|nr:MULTISPECIES: 2-phospho-L-lactate guanylyltransferase [unclassified Rathayibacter]MBF4462020.1 2-phospho-L-lactate guanylyltransferase [Rathayibacter sp. VKM Ac-2879]MBF4503937.1 2-phospho-L-lactate guanylyltransferase [Rathayibacter sp. VKM Ac-2878]